MSGGRRPEPSGLGENPGRNAAIVSRRRSGESLAAIGAAYGLSDKTVSSIVHRADRADLLAMASAFDVLPPGSAKSPLRLDMVRVERRGYPPHPEAWAISSAAGSCLTRDGEWEWEPMPSGRDDDWYARARWPSAAEAIAFAREHLRRHPTGFRHDG